MNRIICDICGTEYAETSECCPICGYPRQGTEKTAAVAGDTVRTKVKGGRFSSKNVKKRRKAQRQAAEGKERSDKPLLIVIALLAAAIVLVSLYIALRFFWGSDFGSDRRPNQAAKTAPAVTTAAPAVPCAGIVMDTAVIALDAPGQEQQLVLTVLPEDTTDALHYATSDAGVVSVSEDGKLTAVGPGQAVVTITCGAVVKECTVVCWFEEETTAPPATTVPPETAAPTEATESKPEAPKGLTLDQSDVSFFEAGQSITIRVKLDGKSVSRSDVTWTSSDPGVATVENGLVTTISKGTATITASYQGKKATCIVRCRFENPAGSSDQGTADWKASHCDVSIKVGESFPLTVKNGSGETADAIWTMSIDGIVSIDGKTVIGRAPGTVTLKTTVDGITFTCIVRVR